MAKNRSTLIIGIGNTLRGDDGAGIVAVRRLQQLVTTPNFKFIEAYQLLPEHAAEIANCGQVIFIDAEVGPNLGKIRQIEITPEAVESAAYTHEFTPQRLLALAREISGQLPKAALLSIETDQFEDVDQLSEEVKQAVQIICNQIIEQTW